MAPIRRFTADRIAPWAVLALFLGLTALATKYVWDSSQVADRARFDRVVQATMDQVTARIDMHVNVLRAATGLFAATEDVTRDQFRAYVRSLDIAHRDPGMQGIGISVRVRPENVEAVVADLRANDVADFRIFPEGGRDEYHTIVVLEPLNGNRVALGYDMFTHPVRRAAMERARDTGQPAASGPVTLIHLPRQTGFLIYVPIYTTETVPATVQERREALYGFVYAPFRAGELFKSIFAPSSPSVVASVNDGNTLLYSDDLAGGAAQARYTAVRRMDAAGREWTMAFASQPAPLRLSPLTIATAVGGVFVSVLLFLLMRVQLRARSEAERVAETLRRSESELQAASRAKDEFLATLSHELRTPMTAILGWSKMLTEDLDPDTHRVATSAILKSSKSQAQLIDDLLDVSRITAGKMNIETSALDLAPIVRAAVDAVSPAADAKSVAVDVSLPSRPVQVSADPNRMQQVIWNLVSNAVKFTPAGGKVDVVLTDDEAEAVVTVTDTGEGIEPDFLPFVFERFRQADSSTTRPYTGLGLGLAIVRHLVELHGGTVEAHSDGAGRGARFTVRLPLLPGEAHLEETLRRDDQAIALLRGAKILVVDDEDDVRNYAAAVFRMSGAEVRTVRSADEALDVTASWRPDVVVSDLGMPQKDGFELLRAIRASRDGLSGVPVIALTAYARPEDRKRAERAGFDAFVPKPVDPMELRQAVGRVLSGSVLHKS
jgi:signal transduction histidine kinase/CheY-like chemotaxis protein